MIPVPASSGRTGVRVSRFGLGTMVLGAWGNTDHAACVRIIHRALDAGINLVDTADVYAAGESEEIVGQRCAGRRDDVVLATKFHNADGRRPEPAGATRAAGSRRAVEDSLRRLGTDHIDLYQIHRPDPDTPIDETVDALDRPRPRRQDPRLGHVDVPRRASSSRRAGRRSAAASPARTPSSRRTRSSTAASSATSCRCASATASACSCGARSSGGWLTGKYRRDGRRRRRVRAPNQPRPLRRRQRGQVRRRRAPAQVADDAGLPLAHLALAWAAEHPAVTSVLHRPAHRGPARRPARRRPTSRSTPTCSTPSTRSSPPGADLNPADAGWVPPGLAPAARRRPRS